MLLGNDKSDIIGVLIFETLIDSCISNDEFVSVNNVLSDYNEMKEEIKKSWKCCEINYIKTMETYCVSCKKNIAKENSSVRKTKQNTK